VRGLTAWRRRASDTGHMHSRIAPLRILRAALALLASVVWGTPVLAAVPAGFVQSTLAGGLTDATAMAFAPDGRLFVCEQGGALRVIRDGLLLPDPFVMLTVDPDGERGLLGVAFDPGFATTPYVYVYYTVPSGPHNRISRFLASGDVATGSEQILLELNTLSSATNHNGGAIHFGADGKLYAGVGENANGSNAQSTSNLLGKMLRINKDGSIPTDNPFFNNPLYTGNNRAIWALGLRNPFTFAFDAAGTRMFINDVGESSWEEINDGIAGANYGWSIHEGVANDPPYVDPLRAYAHGSGTATGCAIAGGAFHDTAKVSWPADFAGDYFYADLCSGWIRRFDAALGTTAAFATGISSPVDLQIGPNGDLYYLARGAGAVGRISTDWIFGDGFEAGS
jgi:glucose/arabinose dehydrogenase